MFESMCLHFLRTTFLTLYTLKSVIVLSFIVEEPGTVIDGSDTIDVCTDI